ncbi:thioredoxin domain-containing protein [Formosa sp. A9]|uniref:thioredoxin domain-containing protein n=1 Tax=Formosa sp. A9 TaxID=3442641 RepID=UPI003EB7E892
MKAQFLIRLYLGLMFLSVMACQQDEHRLLAPSGVAQIIEEQQTLQIIDVRTPEEFNGGHLEDAKNFNWKDDSFTDQISALNPSEPILVYCLSGGRSAKAAEYLRNEGFKYVYELDGGIVKWRSENRKEVAEEVVDSGMSLAEFQHMLVSDKLVLVDFYAEWCLPCKKMEPYLNDIASDMATTVKVVRIDADKNKALCKTLNVAALPVLQLYKDETKIWVHSGFIEKEEVLKQLQ